MAFDFLEDLDEYFCEKYANYDHICILNGYEMPKMQTTERREDGTDYSYTLPASTMRLAAQRNRKDLLAQLKERMTDTTFSFTFRPLGLFARIKGIFAKRTFKKALPEVLARYSTTSGEAVKLLDIDVVTWSRICKGIYEPTKNLLFSLALTVRMTPEDLEELFGLCGYELDYSLVKDTVIAYLLTRKVYNADLVRRALEEYKVTNLFIKEL